MSSVPMLPEMSTASIKSRPVVGRVTGSPVHCGRAAAVNSASQASHSSAGRQCKRRVRPVKALSGCRRNELTSGTVRAAWRLASGRQSQRSKAGSGASSRT